MTVHTKVLEDIEFKAPAAGSSLQKLAITGSIVAAWAAFAWLALGAESIARPVQVNYRDALWMVPFVLTAIAFTFLHAVQRSQTDHFETASFYFLMTASALGFLGNTGILTNQPLLASFAFPWGAILWMLGLVAYGIATLKAKVVPRYVAISIILLEPGSLLTGLALSPIAPIHDRGAYSAGIEKGLVLALLALGMKQLVRKDAQPVK
jgi:hypothetical protein